MAETGASARRQRWGQSRGTVGDTHPPPADSPHGYDLEVPWGGVRGGAWPKAGQG